jgi:hypothetical protein
LKNVALADRCLSSFYLYLLATGNVGNRRVAELSIIYLDKMVPVLIIAGVKLHVILECVAAVEPLGTEVAGEGHLAAVDEVVLLETGLAIN